MADKPAYAWHAFRAGGSDQIALTSGEDIARLPELDQKLWSVLSCPTEGVVFDPATLKALDSDGDKHIRVPEILAAIAWVKARLASLDELLAPAAALPLSTISRETAEGKAVLDHAQRLLASLDRGKTESLSLAETSAGLKAFSTQPFNGDGVVPPESAPDPALAQTLKDIMATCGTVAGCDGRPGVTREKTDAFFAAVAARLDWAAAAKSKPELLPLGDKTTAAAAALDAVAAKIDDFFTRSALAAFDARSAAPLSRSDADYAALAAQPLTDSTPALAAFPLAAVSPVAELPLSRGVNPYWADALAAANALAFAPMHIGETLTREAWLKLKAAFAPYRAWAAAEAGKEVASLAPGRLAELARPETEKAVAALLARDAAAEPEYEQLAELDKLVRYYLHRGAFLENSVNMARLYNPETSPMARVGTLYIDGRACRLCFHVADAAAHSALAAPSNCCLVYCDLKRPGSGEKRTICATVTAGTARSLAVGRNGIFYDIGGKDWEAAVTPIVEHAICLREAFWYPWRKMAELLSGQIKKLLSAKQDAAVDKGMTNLSAAAPAATDAPQKKLDGAALASSVAAIGIAVGLVGSAIGGLVSVIAGLPIWKTLLGVAAVILIVSLPSVILTWFKLRARDLAPILNACGWAVNRRLGFTLKLGRLFTLEAELPPGAVRSLRDPYADPGHPLTWVLLAILVIELAAVLGYGLLK